MARALAEEALVKLTVVEIMVVRAEMMVMKAVVEKTIAVTRAMVIELAVVAARV